MTKKVEKHVLFLTAQYPPLNVAGSYRPAKFAKYMERYGWKPVVLTLDPDSLQQEFAADLDPELDISLELDIFRTKIYLPKKKNKWLRYFEVNGDLDKRWEPFALPAVEEIRKQYNVQLVFTSIPPFPQSFLALRIARLLGVPMVVDFRDAWSQWCITPYRTRLHYYGTVLAERRILKAAAAVISTSPQTRADLLQVHRMVGPEKVNIIPNGYDFTHEFQAFQSPSIHEKEKYVIGYVGSFYYVPAARENMMKPWYRKRGHRIFQYAPRREDWLFRSPFFFFQSLQLLLEKHPDWKSKIVFRLVGKKPDWFDAMVSSFGLSDIIDHRGFLPYEKAMDVMGSCDAFLSTSAKVYGGEDYSIASKTFDYLRFAKPILGFVPPGAQRDFLFESGVAVLFDPEKPNQAANSLESFFFGGKEFVPNRRFLATFQRITLTERLAGVFDKLMEDFEGPNQ